MAESSGSGLLSNLVPVQKASLDVEETCRTLGPFNPRLPYSPQFPHPAVNKEFALSCVPSFSVESFVLIWSIYWEFLDTVPNLRGPRIG